MEGGQIFEKTPVNKILINKEGKEFGKVIGEIDFASDEFINFLRKYI